jgi:hypothetical protein
MVVGVDAHDGQEPSRTLIEACLRFEATTRGNAQRKEAEVLLCNEIVF